METKRSFRLLDALLQEGEEKPAGFLDQLTADWSADAALLSHVVGFAEQAEPAAQTAATGLLKRYLTTGTSLPVAIVPRFLALLPSLRSWEAKLNGLQSLPFLPIPTEEAEPLHRFLQVCSAGANKFVRAWGYCGLHRLATLHPGYRTRVSALIEQARREDAPSVRARLRHLPPL